MPLTLTDRTLIITGAGSGIGRAAALEAAAAGAHIVVSDLNGDTAEGAVAEIASAGGSASAVVGDVADPAVVEEMVAEATARGTLRGIVNNAGVMDLFSGVAETEDAVWERCLRVNTTAPFMLMRAAVPVLRENGGGSIVNVLSEAALRGAAAGAAYSASKHAVVGLTKNTAYRYAADGIRANAVLPAGVETNIMSSIDPTKIDQEAMGVLGTVHASAVRTATPAEVAALIIFLLADESSNVSGAIIPCDAGWSAG